MRVRILAIVVATLAALTLAAPAPAAAPWLTSGTTFSAPGNDHVKVVGLRFAARSGFDRVVIDLRGRQPDYRTIYSNDFTFDGSGNPIPIRGRSGLQIFLTAAGHNAAGDNVYTGPRLARPRFDTLKALALAGDFEGQVTFAFALRHRAPYRITHLTGPSRLVIDFQHR